MIIRYYFYSGVIEDDDPKFFCGIKMLVSWLPNPAEVLELIVTRRQELYKVAASSVNIKEFHRIQ